jgi:hypothetical protein
MKSLFIFVKQRDGVLNVNLAAAAGKTGAEVIGVERLDDFEGTLEFQKQDHSIKKLTIWSHGEPGMLDFRGDRFDVGAVRRFNGKGFADLFADDARIIFDGCQVGAGAKGLEFVKEVARVFLSTGGGRVSARSEFVLSAPIFTSEVFSLGGLDVHALINKGGLKLRIGLGNELKSPEGDWHIREDSNKWMYRFFGNGTVRYQDEKKLLGRMNILDLEETEGRWTREAAAVKVTWPSGTIETWELPLFDGYQPVTWNRFDGRVQSLIATKSGEYNESTP